MPLYTISDLYDLSHTMAAPLFQGRSYPWEVLDHISAFILEVGPTLPQDKFDQIAPDVWVAKSAKVAPNAFIGGPCIIDEDAEVRHCAFIRGSAVVGKKAVVGNSTELKNVILFDKVQVPHFNYVGDSVLGYAAHLGAGVITTNIKSDKSLISIRSSDQVVDTGRRKAGTFAGDFAEVGCNSALAPGCILGRNTIVYPTSHVRGQLPQDHIFKGSGNVVKRNI